MLLRLLVSTGVTHHVEIVSMGQLVDLQVVVHPDSMATCDSSVSVGFRHFGQSCFASLDSLVELHECSLAISSIDPEGQNAH